MVCCVCMWCVHVLYNVGHDYVLCMTMSCVYSYTGTAPTTNRTIFSMNSFLLWAIFVSSTQITRHVCMHASTYVHANMHNTVTIHAMCDDDQSVHTFAGKRVS